MYFSFTDTCLTDTWKYITIHSSNLKQKFCSENIDGILIPLMVLGAVFLLIGMLGCLGGCIEKDWLLKTYFGLVLIIVIAQIALIIAGKYLR